MPVLLVSSSTNTKEGTCTYHEIDQSFWEHQSKRRSFLMQLPVAEAEQVSMELPLAGLGLGVIAQVRTVTLSITARIENYRQGRKTFQSLAENLTHLTESIGEVEKLLQKFPKALPADISTLFNSTFDRVHKSLRDSESTVEKNFVKTFGGSSSGFFGNLKTKAYRAIRANALNKKMSAVETQIKEASAQLLQLTVVLANALNVLELAPKIDKLRVNDSEKEEYSPAMNAPAVSHIVDLDFDSKDAEGEFATPEGAFKDKVLVSDSPETITAAAGKLNPAFGVVGMAGVGKTVALQGLAGDEDIRARFPDGIHYMRLGQEATPESVIQEIVQTMTMTGATASVARVESSTSLGKAVGHACTWFHDKKCLFLVDDLWPTGGCPTGFLADLRQLLRESPNSRMAISTRSVKIALEAGSVVDFGAREPLGPVSVSIFMKYATCSTTVCVPLDSGDELPSTVTKILTWCGGLPIALSVTGSAVALLLRSAGSLERACEIYVTDFEDGEANVGDEEDSQGSRLNDGIRLSLKYLDAEFLKWKERHAVDTNHTISGLYTSLSVLTNQVWIPVAVLSRMWQLSEKSALGVVQLFCGLSLASLSFRKIGGGGIEKAGLTLHDLHLEFCKQQAGSKISENMWHSALLNGYMDAPPESMLADICTQSSQQLVDVTPRSWWTIPEDGYIHANLARHLLLSDRGPELAALLLDARWANVRGKIGGILGLQADFETLYKHLSVCNSDDGENNPSKGIRKGFQLVFKAMKLSWGSFSDGQRAFQFQMCGRLLHLENDDVIIDAVSKSFELHTPKPCLMPVSRFFPELNGAQILEIPVGGVGGCVACSPCGRYIAAGAGRDVVIVDPTTGDVLKRLKGHSANVRCIRFAETSKKIVSASNDKIVAVWEWEKSGEPILLLEGHSDFVRSVDVSRDGECIVSGSRDRTVRLWNGLTGVQTLEFAQRSAVRCVALCSEDNKVAIGLENGTVKVLDRCTGDTVFEDTEAHTQLVESVAFSSDGQRMATGAMDETIRVWDADTWAAIGSPVVGHANNVTSVAFSPDGQQLVSGSWDHTVRLWDVAPAEYVEESSSRSVRRERNIFSCDFVDSVTFTCNGDRVVSASLSGTVRIWDAAFVSEEEQQGFDHREPVLAVSVSPDGLRVATGSGRTVCLWSSQTGAQIGIPLAGHISGVTCVSFSRDGRHLVSSSLDGTLRMWDIKTFTQIGIPFEGHSDWVWCVTFCSDGHRIISGGGDKTVRLWDVQTRQQIGDPLIGHAHVVRWVSESSDGRFVVSRDWSTEEDAPETIIWNSNDSAIVWRSKDHTSDACNRVTNIEAENIVRSCGRNTPHLWPSCFSEYTAEIFYEGHTFCTFLNGDKILLGNIPAYASLSNYDFAENVFACGLESGSVAICRLVV